MPLAKRLLLSAALLGAPAYGSPPPWIARGAVPLPAETRSVEVLRNDEPLRARPFADAARRGSAAKGALLPLYGAELGAGCSEPWLLVGPTAWICGEHVRLSRSAPLEARSTPQRFADGLPYHYYFVGELGSFGYAKLGLAEEGIPDAQLEPGFAIAVAQQANRFPGDPFGLTTKGLWVPMRDMVPARPSLFRGVHLKSGDLDVAWVLDDATPVYEAPGGRRVRDETFDRLSRVIVREARTKAGGQWVRIERDRWMRRKDLRVATLSEPPEHTRPAERWVDVDLENQTVTAYEGTRPVFVTLASTGKGQGNHPQATPRGAHRIWVKLRTTDMTNLEDDSASRYYAIEDVPWVMFFNEGYGLHGAFWHRSFGRVRSHGCVNLTPLDAQWLFAWASPRLPVGWSAVLPTRYDRGTLVRVR